MPSSASDRPSTRALPEVVGKEAEQGSQQGRLAGAVGPEQTDRAPPEGGAEIDQDRSPTEIDGETLELDRWREGLSG